MSCAAPQDQRQIERWGDSRRLFRFVNSQRHSIATNQVSCNFLEFSDDLR